MKDITSFSYQDDTTLDPQLSWSYLGSPEGRAPQKNPLSKSQEPSKTERYFVYHQNAGHLARMQHTQYFELLFKLAERLTQQQKAICISFLKSYLELKREEEVQE